MPSIPHGGFERSAQQFSDRPCARDPVCLPAAAPQRRRAAAPARLFRRQRGLPLPRPVVRRSALRTGRRARGCVASHRGGGGGLRALATSLANAGEARPGRVAPGRVPRARLRADERGLLRRDRPLAACDGGGDRIHRPGRAGSRRPALGPQPHRGRRRDRRRLPVDARPVRRASPSALRSPSPTRRCSPSTSSWRIASRAGRTTGGIDGLAAAMLFALLFVSPIGSVDAARAFADPVALAAGIGVGVTSSVIPYVFDQLAMARLARETYALFVALLPATAAVIGVIVLVAASLAARRGRDRPGRCSASRCSDPKARRRDRAAASRGRPASTSRGSRSG